MNIAWIIFDSVSYEATTFSDNNVDTTPKLQELANDCGLVFTRAYSPGYASPDSHGSIFTGKYPSETGIHKATPRSSGYKCPYPTLGELTAESHDSLLVTTNPFLFDYGLDSGFDTRVDLFEQEFYPFPDAPKPSDFSFSSFSFSNAIKFTFERGKPLRSIANGLKHKFVQEKRVGTSKISETNEQIRNFATKDIESSKFIVANYMHAHPPFDPTKDSCDRYLNVDSNELPIKETLPFRTDQEPVPEFDSNAIFGLYQASIYDLDQQVTPLIKKLLANEFTVFLTADHGRAAIYDDPLGEFRIHVPLIIFSNDVKSSYIRHTVNLRSIAPTTTNLLMDDHPSVSAIDGHDLMNTDEDQLSLTEYIHDPQGYLNDPPASTETIRGASKPVVYRLAAIMEDTRVDYYDHNESFECTDGTPALCDDIQETLKSHIEEIKSLPDSSVTTEVGQIQEERLRKLGYLS